MIPKRYNSDSSYFRRGWSWKRVMTLYVNIVLAPTTSARDSAWPGAFLVAPGQCDPTRPSHAFAHGIHGNVSVLRNTAPRRLPLVIWDTPQVAIVSAGPVSIHAPAVALPTMRSPRSRGRNPVGNRRDLAIRALPIASHPASRRSSGYPSPAESVSHTRLERVREDRNHAGSGFRSQRY